MELTRNMFLPILAFLSTTQWCEVVARREPVCTSRFDFESSLLAKMVQVEFDMSKLKEKTAEALAELDTYKKALKEEQALKLEELSSIGNELRRDTEAITNLENELQEKADVKRKQIEAQATKPTVAFVAKKVSDKSPGRNKMLKFTETVFNTGNAYSASTGYFTAPVGGTYWFSVQVCPRLSKYVQVEIHAEGTVVASSTVYDATGHNDCSTVSTVAVLLAGNKVSVYSGGASSSSGVIIAESSSRWPSFSGSLVN